MNIDFPLKRIEDIASIGHSIKWQYFEKIVGFVFKENNFSVSISTVKSFNGVKRQFDVIAESPRYVFTADCKRWTKRRYKSSMLKTAVEKQVERSCYYKGESEKTIIPLIVTLMHEDLVMHEGVFIIPIEKLNDFILNWEEKYSEEVTKI